MTNDKKKLRINSIKIANLLLVFILFAVFLVGCNPANKDYRDLFIPTTFTPTTASIFVDDLGYNSIRLNENRDVKILQLTDTHIGNGNLSVKKDRKAMEAVCELIRDTNPDLIILTGDVVYPMSIFTGTNDNLSALRAIAKVVDSYQTPWTMIFGNHDAESGSKYSKSELCNYLESDQLKYCLFDRGPSDIDGMGNHIINVYNKDNSFNSSMIMMDNGEYAGALQISGYAPISSSQTNWYKSSVLAMNEKFGGTIQSFIFYHVPDKDYKVAWEAYRSGSSDATYHYGWANEKSEKISCPKDSSPLSQAIIDLGSTKGIFCGHNHLNDFSITYKGVRYTFGKSIDYIAYPGIANKTEQRGGTILMLKGLNSSMTEKFTIRAIKLVDIK